MEILERLEALDSLDIAGVDQLATDIRAAYQAMRDSGQVDLNFGRQLQEALATINTRRAALVTEAEEAAQELAALDAAIFSTPDTDGDTADADADVQDPEASDAGDSTDGGDAAPEGDAPEGDATPELSTPAAPVAPRIIQIPPLAGGTQAPVPESDEGDAGFHARVLNGNDKEISLDQLGATLTRAAKTVVPITQEQFDTGVQTEGALPKTAALKFEVSSEFPRVGRFEKYEDSASAFAAHLEAKRQEREAAHVAQASGGPCAPRRQEYAIDIIGGDAEPVGDSLVSVVSDGKGVSFFRDLEFSDMVTNWAGGINTYTQAQDISAAAYPKGIATITCPTSATCDKEIREKGIKFGNWVSWAFPELVEAIQKGGRNIFARHLEEARLNAIYAQAGTLGNILVDAAQNLDASINVVDKILRVVTAERRDNRTSSDQRYIAYFPEWAKAQLQLGLISMLDGIGDNATVENAVLELLRRWNIDVVFYKDNFSAANGTAGDLPTAIQNLAGTGFPLWQSSIRVGLVRDDAVYLDRGPTLDLGLIRTQSDVEQNNYTLFYETLEGICFKNKGVFVLDLLLSPTGAQAGTVTPTATGTTA